ncbi:30S ribosomal protein S5 [Candidatus Parcubacteria bacterium]|nr:MAG: 30S ribosomal protein S5 [Candidatus Parcubacteria bacterium]
MGSEPRRFGSSDNEQKVIDLRRVTRVVAGGKRFKFRATVVMGNRAGKVGVGVDKGEDVSQAVEKASRSAQRNFITVPFVDDTIPHEVLAKYKTATVLIKPAAKGSGVIAGGAVRVVLDLAGIKNVTAKILSRTTNKLNNARAAIEALKQLKTSARPRVSSAEKSEQKK